MAYVFLRFSYSYIFPILSSKGALNELAKFFCCKKGDFPIKCLGVPAFHKVKKRRSSDDD